MPRLQLTGGAYQARSIIASAQSCVNLFAEPMPQGTGEEAAYAYYPTPGLTLLGTAPATPFRGGITCSDGRTYIVAGNHVYWVILLSSTSITFNDLGTVAPGITTPVGMAENGANAALFGTGTLVIADGTNTAYSVAFGGGGPGAVTPIADPNFQGATNFQYLDTFFISNVPGTAQFQVGNSNALTWDPLYIAKKASHSDLIQTIIVTKREIWLLGTTTSEVWYNTGASDFPFQEMQGVFIDHGCVGTYCAAELDNTVYWLSQDRYGQNIVLAGSGYQTTRISTYALEAELSTYGQVGDAEAHCHQQGGHQFFVLSFPAQDKTWVYDISTKQWHRRVWTSGGVDHRWRVRQAWLAFYQGRAPSAVLANFVMAGDWQNGNIYRLDPKVFTDNGTPIRRERAFPHLLNDGNRQMYWEFIADMECGNTLPGATDINVSLDWSDDRGRTYGNTVPQSIGTNGQFLISMQWQRLGMARDRVFRLSWTCPFETALQGAWIEAEKSEG